MRLATRLAKIETKLGHKDTVPGLLVVFKEADGTWSDGRGGIIDRTTVDPRTTVICLTGRSDGPQ